MNSLKGSNLGLSENEFLCKIVNKFKPKIHSRTSLIHRKTLLLTFLTPFRLAANWSSVISSSRKTLDLQIGIYIHQSLFVRVILVICGCAGAVRASQAARGVSYIHMVPRRHYITKF